MALSFEKQTQIILLFFFANLYLSLYQSAYSNSFEVFDNWPLIYNNKVLGIVYSVLIDQQMQSFLFKENARAKQKLMTLAEIK